MGTAARVGRQRRPEYIAPAGQPAVRPRAAGRFPRAVAIAAAVTALLMAGTIWPASPLEALGLTRSMAGAVLRLPAAYVALSPLCAAYDALTVLTISQHAALLGWLLAIFAVSRALAWIAPRPSRRRPTVLREAMLLGMLLLGFAGVYVIGAIAPRPMAALALTDRDELAVDVHSHTSSSHDGRIDFDAEMNRRWHAAAGFDAAYITDHRSFAGANAGAAGNPRRAGDGTVLLSGIESLGPHSHVTILGARPDMALDTDGRADLARLSADTNVVVVLTTPAKLSLVPATLRLDAVENSDGAPLGLKFTRTSAPEIARFAAERKLVRVAGSNNHGWGRTASAWTVMRVPGWRGMSPDSLDGAIRATLRSEPAAVRVIARGATPLPRSAAALIATPASFAWMIVTRLSPAERVSWLVWIWSIAGLALLARRPARAPRLAR